MTIVFLFVGGQREEWLVERTEYYTKCISRFHRVEVRRAAPETRKRGDHGDKSDSEGERILDELRSGDFVVILDENGKEFTSVRLAQEFQGWLNRGPKRLVFIVGGPYGHSEKVKARADTLLSLSKLTLNHHLAQFLIVEQIWRVVSILHGLPYHNE